MLQATARAEAVLAALRARERRDDSDEEGGGAKEQEGVGQSVIVKVHASDGSEARFKVNCVSLEAPCLRLASDYLLLRSVHHLLQALWSLCGIGFVWRVIGSFWDSALKLLCRTGWRAGRAFKEALQGILQEGAPWRNTRGGSFQLPL
jgi:hypothetical protein